MVCVGVAAVVAVNPGLGWFALVGLLMGVAVRWVRQRQWQKLAIAVTLSFIAFVVVLLPSLVTEKHVPFDGVSISVPMSARMEYRADEEAFEITDTVGLTDASSNAMCGVNQQRPDRRDRVLVGEGRRAYGIQPTAARYQIIGAVFWRSARGRLVARDWGVPEREVAERAVYSGADGRASGADC